MSKHIRPKVRSRRKPKGNDSVPFKTTEKDDVPVSSGGGGVDDLLEETRKQMSNVLNISSTSSILASNYLKQKSFLESDAQSLSGIKAAAAKGPKGILKSKARYQGNDAVDASKQVHERSVGTTHHLGMSSLSAELGLPESDLSAMDLIDNSNGGQQRAIGESCVRDIVVERKNPIADPFPTYDASLIEGHLPKYSIQEKNMAITNDEENNIDSEHIFDKEIETNMEFSCMTREEYDESVEMAIAAGVSVEEFLGQQEEARRNEEIIDDVEDEKKADEDESMTEIDSTERDEFLDFFSTCDEEDEEEILPPPKPRPFMILWNAITTWMTGEAMLCAQNLSSNAVERNDILEKEHAETRVIDDIGVSRCKGLMAMLKFNLIKALEDLGHNADDGFTRKTSEEQLGKWVQFFNFSEPMVKLDSTMWRALTVILLNNIMPKDDLAHKRQSDREKRFPESAKAAGLTFDEYHYLAESAIPSLSSGIEQ